MFALADIAAAKPAWVTRTLEPKSIPLLIQEIRNRRAVSAIEIGVASGFSSAIIWAALKCNTDNPRLYSFDLSEQLYYDASKVSGLASDKGRKTGDAFFELHGPQPGFHLKTGVISAEIDVTEKVDFVLIDANHRAPWPALDLLAASRFLATDALIVLDDLETLYRYRWHDMNGPRDLYRAWTGIKWRYAAEPNMGFLRFASLEALAASINIALLPDWERNVPEIEKYVALSAYLPEIERSALVRTMRARSGSNEVLR